MLNFAKYKGLIGQHNLETKCMTFKAIDLKMKRS